jgi:hypothetical protein
MAPTGVGGLVKYQVYRNRVPREPWKAERLIPTHRIDEPRDNKNRTSSIVKGNRTVASVHYGEVATPISTYPPKQQSRWRLNLLILHFPSYNKSLSFELNLVYCSGAGPPHRDQRS